MGVPFLLHEDHLDVSPTRSTFSFGSFSGIGEDRRTIEKGGWQTTILGEFGFGFARLSKWAAMFRV